LPQKRRALPAAATDAPFLEVSVFFKTEPFLSCTNASIRMHPIFPWARRSGAATARLPSGTARRHAAHLSPSPAHLLRTEPGRTPHRNVASLSPRVSLPHPCLSCPLQSTYLPTYLSTFHQRFTGERLCQEDTRARLYHLQPRLYQVDCDGKKSLACAVL
jgi:hypothetical protein